MIEFNAGSFTGEGFLEKLTTYRDGGLSIPIRVNNTPEAAVLLANVNKICRLTATVDDKTVQAEGELAKLSTLRKGGIDLAVVVNNEPKVGAFFLANIKKAGTVVFEFSSAAGKMVVDEPEPAEQPNLEGLEDGAE